MQYGATLQIFCSTLTSAQLCQFNQLDSFIHAIKSLTISKDFGHSMIVFVTNHKGQKFSFRHYASYTREILLFKLGKTVARL